MLLLRFLKLLFQTTVVLGVMVGLYYLFSPKEGRGIAEADGVVGGIWFDHPVLDSKGTYPCVDVRLTLADGGHKDLLGASVKSRKDGDNLCMGYDENAQWVFENGQKKDFRPEHRKLVKERGRFY